MDLNEENIAHRPELERMIVGALKDAINQHGPITRENVSSASKRVLGALKNQIGLAETWKLRYEQEVKKHSTEETRI